MSQIQQFATLSKDELIHMNQEQQEAIAQYEDKRISKQEAAKMIGCSEDTLDNYRAQGKIAYTQYVERGAVSFLLSDIITFRLKHRKNSNA